MSQRIKIWDLPIRVFHWCLVLLIATLWFTGTNSDEYLELHILIGTAVFTLVVTRILWGVVGSSSARFTHFIKGPGKTIAYFRTILTPSPAPVAGHNPLGAWMIVALLTSILVQTSTGLFGNDDSFTEGPLASLISKELSDQLTYIHRININVLLVLASIHILANLYYLIVKKDNLILPMITGSREWPIQLPKPSLKFRSAWIALVILLVIYFGFQLVIEFVE